MELLALRATPETPCADIRTRALDKITAIEEKIEALNAMKYALAKLVEECSGQGEITDCPILASLDTEGKVHHCKETTMATTRTIEIFSAGCPACDATVELVNRIACPSCDVTVLDMHNPDVARRAKSLEIRSVPAVVINGTLADCCAGRGVDEATLRAAGLGQAL
jgi:glutaredoxin